MHVNQHPIGIDRSLIDITEAQRAIYDEISQGPRGAVPSPFLAMLDRPALAKAIQQTGVELRFRGILSGAERELAILATAGTVGCGYEWQYHAPIARREGLADHIIEATRKGIAPSDEHARWAVIIRFCQSVTATRRVSRELLAEVLELVGREGATELVAIAGYYALLASFIIIGGHDISLSN
ncbi:4-carboxymuconolactone decarboxylase (plasmid) [Sphingobium sp. EP60837]|nr:4-carboxymuconolactone decarboxylase [Sphingobium sp. EP60837]